jgi:hypothetical protein
MSFTHAHSIPTMSSGKNVQPILQDYNSTSQYVYRERLENSKHIRAGLTMFDDK